MSRRVYDKVRCIVERLGGTMVYEREGYRQGAWVIKIGDKGLIIEATGNRSFPQLDRLHVPRVPEPRYWDDYAHELLPDAEAQLLSMLSKSGQESPTIPVDTDELTKLIDQTRWKFAWTYARTYPHEYTTKALCPPDDHAKLIDCIEQ